MKITILFDKYFRYRKTRPENGLSGFTKLLTWSDQFSFLSIVTLKNLILFLGLTIDWLRCNLPVNLKRFWGFL